MKPSADKFTIFVVCDSPRHPKPQAITNFQRNDAGDWVEIYPGNRKSGDTSAVRLVGSNKPTYLDRVGDREYWGDARRVYELPCRKCGDRFTFQWRAEHLYALFDSAFTEYSKHHAPIGVLPLSLTAISASIGSSPKA